MPMSQEMLAVDFMLSVRFTLKKAMPRVSVDGAQESITTMLRNQGVLTP